MALALQVAPETLATFCVAHGLRRLSIFGSALRDDFRENSDLDVLVEFEVNREVGLIRFAGLERELTEIFGRRVDLRTPDDLSPLFRDKVLAQAEVLYESR